MSDFDAVKALVNTIDRYEEDGYRDGLRAAMEAATQAELEPDSDDLFYAPGERGLRAIERLLEQAKKGGEV